MRVVGAGDRGPERITVCSAESLQGVPDAVAPEVVEDLAGGVMVPAVDRQAEAHVAVDGVEALGLLELTGAQLVAETDSAALVPAGVRQDRRG